MRLPATRGARATSRLASSSTSRLRRGLKSCREERAAILATGGRWVLPGSRAFSGRARRAAMAAPVICCGISRPSSGLVQRHALSQSIISPVHGRSYSPSGPRPPVRGSGDASLPNPPGPPGQDRGVLTLGMQKSDVREEVNWRSQARQIWKRAWSTNAQKAQGGENVVQDSKFGYGRRPLVAVTAPAFAADAPKTKADCEKTKDMKWDDATKACVLKK